MAFKGLILSPIVNPMHSYRMILHKVRQCSFPISFVEGEKDIDFYKAKALVIMGSIGSLEPFKFEEGSQKSANFSKYWYEWWQEPIKHVFEI